MEIVILPAVLAVILLSARRPVFEGTFAVVLLAPLLAFGAAHLGGIDLRGTAYLLSLLVLFIGVMAVTPRGGDSYRIGREVEPVVVFAVGFAFFHALNQH